MPAIDNAHRLFLALALAATAAAQSTAPCWETSLGSNLLLGDEQVAQNLQLGFAFPGPSGPITAIDVSSNGFLWLARNPNSDCCAGNAAQFVLDLPRIAALWVDLDPSAGGGVWFNTFPGRAVITWDHVPEFHVGAPLGVVTMQVQLESNGTISINHQPGTMAYQNAGLVGVTQGNGATPNPVNFSTVPILGTTNPTVYEEFAAGTFDLAGRNLQFVPTGGGGYVVLERALCRLATFGTFGTGCPQGQAVFEQFAANAIDLTNQSFRFTPNGQGGYQVTACTGLCYHTAISNNLLMYYDEVQRAFALPFAFPFPGGSTTAIDISSNGQIYLVPNTIATSRLGPPDLVAFANDTPSLAPLWLTLFPGLGNGVFFDVDVSGQAVYITFDQVPEPGHLGAINTFQCTLFHDGSFLFSYQAVGSVRGAALTGFSTGNGAALQGPIDWTVTVPFSTGANGAPLHLTAPVGAVPRLGTTFPLQVRDIPANASIGVMALGFTRHDPGLDLTAFGMPNCRQYTSLDALLPLAGTGTSTTLPLGIPNIGTLLGMQINAQAVVAASSLNAMGVITSNGGALGLGM